MGNGLIPEFIYGSIGGLYGITCGLIACLYLVLGIQSLWMPFLMESEYSSYFLATYSGAFCGRPCTGAFAGEPHMHDGATKLVADFVLQLANFAIACHLLAKRNASFFLF